MEYYHKGQNWIISHFIHDFLFSLLRMYVTLLRLFAVIYIKCCVKIKYIK